MLVRVLAHCSSNWAVSQSRAWLKSSRERLLWEVTGNDDGEDSYTECVTQLVTTVGNLGLVPLGPSEEPCRQTVPRTAPAFCFSSGCWLITSHPTDQGLLPAGCGCSSDCYTQGQTLRQKWRDAWCGITGWDVSMWQLCKDSCHSNGWAELLRQGTVILKVIDLRATEGTRYLRDTQPLCQSPRLLPGAAQYPAESASPGPLTPRGQPQSHS